MRLKNKELAFCEELREAEKASSREKYLQAAQMWEARNWVNSPRLVMAVPRNRRVILEDYPEPR